MRIYDGELSLTVALDGELNTQNTYDGELGTYITVTDVNPYEGPYEFTPSDAPIEIQIEHLTALENIRVNPIPSNYGRVSYNGAFLTVE